MDVRIFTGSRSKEAWEGEKIHQEWFERWPVRWEEKKTDTGTEKGRERWNIQNGGVPRGFHERVRNPEDTRLVVVVVDDNEDAKAFCSTLSSIYSSFSLSLFHSLALCLGSSSLWWLSGVLNPRSALAPRVFLKTQRTEYTVSSLYVSRTKHIGDRNTRSASLECTRNTSTPSTYITHRSRIYARPNRSLLILRSKILPGDLVPNALNRGHGILGLREGDKQNYPIYSKNIKNRYFLVISLAGKDRLEESSKLPSVVNFTNSWDSFFFECSSKRTKFVKILQCLVICNSCTCQWNENEFLIVSFTFTRRTWCTSASRSWI